MHPQMQIKHANLIHASCPCQHHTSAGGPITSHDCTLLTGAGIGGPALSLLLHHKLGCQPVVFEAAPSIQDVGAGISLAPNGMNVLKSLGMAEHLMEDVGEPWHIFQALNANGKVIVSFNTLAVKKYGVPAMGFRRSRLRSALLQRMEQAGLPLQLGKRLCDIHQAPGAPTATVAFEDGSTYEADLVVGMDGLRSTTRSIMRVSCADES